ncbi:hypothetical protein Glove_9g300 [Diversispora epigaea]|uniref:Uncharacterized protein n=1 Tax=Diversispora epigaea TaxID=1348612 RepID=A0A397JNS8_9GLOM|nr:hypothetical protein Glove_9g300 [Diversispora epigaea]
MKGNTKRTLFTGVMYWNFVRLGVAFLLNVNAIMSLTTSRLDEPLNLATRTFFNTLAFILMSYVVIFDAEIVKVIKGGNQNKKGSGGPKHKKKSSSTNATHKSADSASLPKHNTLNSNNNIQTYDVSFKRLSFFEWTNVVMEKNCIQESDQEFKEVIEEPLEDINHDLKKGEATIKSQQQY